MKLGHLATFVQIREVPLYYLYELHVPRMLCAPCPAYRELMKQMWGGGGKTGGSISRQLSSTSVYPRELKDAFSRKNPQFSGFK